MALQTTQLAPIVIRGPDADRPDPSTVNAGAFFAPDDVARIDVLRIVGGVRSWVSITTGPAVAATGQGVAPISLNGDYAAHAISGALLFGLTPLVDPVFYVNPTTGSDSNAGTSVAPFQTFDHALKALAPGWYGTATINLQGGTYTIGNRVVLPGPLGNASTTAGGLLINGTDNTDSGLGARTSNGGTTGALQVFGTVIDNVGGLTVNAHRGKFIRFTSGATLNGRSFLIASNTATTFTVCGTLPVAPTTETFVVEVPAATLTWAGTQVMQGSHPVGVQNVAFSGGGGSNAFRLGGFVLGTQRCTFASMGSGGIQLRNGAGLTDLVAIQGYLGTTSITQQCGSHFNGTPLSLSLSSISGLGPSQMNLNRSLFNGSSTELFVPTAIQYSSCYFVGLAYVRVGYRSLALVANCRFDTVTPAPSISAAIVGASGAAIVFSKESSGVVSACDISNTPATTSPGDAILIEDTSFATAYDTTGTGNAGLGCRVIRMSQVRRNSGTTVTGTGGDVQIGSNAVNAWADLSVFIADPVQFCLGAPPT